MIYFLTASGLPPGGSCTMHIYTQIINRTTQNKQIHRTTQNLRTIQKFWNTAGRALLCDLYPGICLTTEEKARKNLSQGSRTIRIRKPDDKITNLQY